MFKQMYLVQWDSWTSLFNSPLHLITSVERDSYCISREGFLFHINPFKISKENADENKGEKEDVN